MILFRRRTRLLVLAFLFLSSLLATGGGIVGETVSGSLFPNNGTAYARTLPEPSLTANIQSAVLDNGLTVVMSPRKSAPVIGISVVYGVGSADENQEAKGVAHMLEHMLFKGTEERPIGFGRLFHALGSRTNAITSDDSTVYHHLVAGRDKMNAILTLEADRMLNARISDEDLAVEKKVVMAEMEIHNEPHFLLTRALLKAAYPNQPYEEDVLGTEASVEGLTQAQLKAFYKKYYSPSNATVIVVGDFDVGDTLSKIETAFGSLKNPKTAMPKPAGRVTAKDATPMVRQTEPLVLRHAGIHSTVQVLFPLPSFAHLDSPAITVLNEMLQSGELYQLERAVVGARRGVRSVELAQGQLRKIGWYSIQVEAEPEQSLASVYETLQQTLLQTIEQLAQSVNPSELSRAKENYREILLSAPETVYGEIGLLEEAQSMAGSYRALDEELAATEAITSEDVQRVARTYLDFDKAVVGFLEASVDTSESPLLGDRTKLTENVLTENVVEAENFIEAPAIPADVMKYLPPLTDSVIALNQTAPKSVVLANGLQVLLLQDNRTPEIAMRGWINAGDRFDPLGKAGTARLTAKGLASYAAKDPSGEKTFSFSADADSHGVNLQANMHSETLLDELENLTSSLQTPAFTEDRFAQIQQRLRNRVAVSLTGIRQSNHRALHQALYPIGHPLHSAITTNSVEAISPTDLQTFYNQYYHPDNTIIALVGAFDPAQIKAQIEQTLGTWQTESKAPTLYPSSTPTTESGRYIEKEIDRETSITYPGAYTLMGHRTITRDDPRYYAFVVASDVLGGGKLASRLADSVRGQGLSYTKTIIDLDIRKDSGTFSIDMRTPVENMDRAVANAIAVLQLAKTEGITTGELQLAKQSLISAYSMTLTDAGDVANVVLDNAINQLDENELWRYSEKIRAVTLEEVQAVIAALIEPEKLVIVTARPNNS